MDSRDGLRNVLMFQLQMDKCPDCGEPAEYHLRPCKSWAIYAEWRRVMKRQGIDVDLL